ncbi:MAG TPA: methyltransferase domain-containing protein [Planctomycetota bacterium]|nr:methyltransferase domain-containing protein [Planctomycetota bacterium]
MITRVRWKEAQARESLAWRRIPAAPRGYLERRGDFLAAWLRFHGAARRRVLEIGGAGLPAPLEGIFGVDPLVRQHAPGGRAVTARAEELPYPDASFDAALALNVVDHVEDPGRCLAEAARVLRPRGVLILSCNVYARAWLLLRAARVRLLGRRNNDVLHPHHFTARSLLALARRRFDVLEASLRLVDPLAGERPFEPSRSRLKGEARLYLCLRPC